MRRWLPTPRLCALALSMSSIVFMPAEPAFAARRVVASAPQITAFEMEPAQTLAAGNELFFRVQGTPGSRVTIRVRGVSRTIVLDEVDDGIYEGAYTLRPNDRVNPGSSATVTVRRNGRSSVSTMARLNAAPPPVAVAPQPKPVQLALSRFAATPVERLEPGTELRFAADGTPGQRASFAIEGVATGIPMREVSPGHYEGSYTLKRSDRITGGNPVVATLEGGGQAVRSQLARSQILADSQAPSVRNQQPREGETVQATGPVTVSANFDDHRGAGVDPSTVRIMLSGRDVTASSTVTRQGVVYRTDLPPGRYSADVSAKDAAGNAVRSAWTFNVEQQPPAAIGLPLAITSHQPNAGVPAGTPVTIRGKTAPGATVHVQVVGVASETGKVGTTERLVDQRIVADANGDFSFQLAPQMPMAGMRYEVDVKAWGNGQAKDTKLVLFQQR